MTTDYAISAVFLEYHIFRRITIYLLIVNPLQTFPLTCGAPLEVIENLEEIEDEGDIYESIEDIWPDYPSKDDFFFNEEEY